MKLNPKWKKTRVVDSGYLDAVAALGCCVCGQEAAIHHIRAGEGAGQRASDYRSIPLCHYHHQTGKHGAAIHAGKERWEQSHGTEIDKLEETWNKLGIDEEQKEKWRQRKYDW